MRYDEFFDKCYEHKHALIFAAGIATAVVGKKILDTKTGIEYDGLVDREFLELVNEIVEEKEKYFKMVKMNYIY